MLFQTNVYEYLFEKTPHFLSFFVKNIYTVTCVVPFYVFFTFMRDITQSEYSTMEYKFTRIRWNTNFTMNTVLMNPLIKLLQIADFSG